MRHLVQVLFFTVVIMVSGPFLFSVMAVGDTCTSAIIVDSLPYMDQDNTAFYLDDYDAVCPVESWDARDVVYSFQPPVDMIIDATLCHDSTNFDTKLYIFENSCDPGVIIACEDDFCRTESMTWAYVSIVQQVSLVAGNTYFFIVDGNRSEYGEYVLEIFESSGDPQLPDPDV